MTSGVKKRPKLKSYTDIAFIPAFLEECGRTRARLPRTALRRTAAVHLHVFLSSRFDLYVIMEDQIQQESNKS